MATITLPINISRNIVQRFVPLVNKTETEEFKSSSVKMQYLTCTVVLMTWVSLAAAVPTYFQKPPNHDKPPASQAEVDAGAYNCIYHFSTQVCCFTRYRGFFGTVRMTGKTHTLTDYRTYLNICV